MKTPARPFPGWLRPTCLIPSAVLLGAFQTPIFATTLPVTLPVMSCADLAKVDFSKLADAPTKLNTTTVVDPAGGSVPTSQCVVTGYVGQDIQFNVRLPQQNWTGRLVMQGCGGYCGTLI